MMKANDNRIPFDVREFNRKNSSSFVIDDFSFTSDELRYVPNFHSMNEAKIHISVLNAGSMMTLTLSVEGNCKLIDAHDGAIIDYELDDSVDVIIAPENEEECDIFPDDDGIYDLRGSILALMFDAIPKNYSLVPLKKVENDNYCIMSEEEYMKEHARSSSPFDSLDDTDFD